jgi:hypothetical protein
LAIAPRVGCTFDQTVGVMHQHPGVAHDIIEGTDFLHIVPGLAKG